MATDPGAQQILDLLSADSVSLTKSGKRLVVAMKRAPKRERGIPAPIAFAAISDIRRTYAELIGQIASVETANPAQADVVTALSTADQGLAVFDEALQAGVNETGRDLAREARRVTKQALRELKAARAALA
jgi:hypothetical protein